MAFAKVTSDQIRKKFTNAMSKMYRDEVPAYAELVDLVDAINIKVLGDDTNIRRHIKSEGGIASLRAERHGAIRIGKPEELSILRRAFAVMGMHPVGYYDLSVAGLPVHSTAFRPINVANLAENPFRIFTSLLRLDQIQDKKLQETSVEILSKRQIISEVAIDLIEACEAQNGLTQVQAERFVDELLETFRWHSEANVDAKTYEALKEQHPLIADIVSFAGPHINHLTPRVLDIDEAQIQMPKKGLNPKESIEGPPLRDCPILLRQTAFKALDEKVRFISNDGGVVEGFHTARFGEIEQRGIALTPIGRKLYDQLLARAKSNFSKAKKLGRSEYYQDFLEQAFEEFPDSWNVIRQKELAYFSYQLTGTGNTKEQSFDRDMSIEELLKSGLVEAVPITYQDFLPVSAAGIFRSNLASEETDLYASNANQDQFEIDLGAPVHDMFELYSQQQTQSIQNCLKALSPISGLD